MAKPIDNLWSYIFDELEQILGDERNDGARRDYGTYPSLDAEGETWFADYPVDDSRPSEEARR